jgi:hypothetical protein
MLRFFADRLGAIMGKLAVALALLLALNAPAFAQACDDDVIESVSKDGAIIKMLAGAVFKVARSDRGGVADWQRSDQVYICSLDTELVNVTVNGDRVTVERVR